MKLIRKHPRARPVWNANSHRMRKLLGIAVILALRYYMKNLHQINVGNITDRHWALAYWLGGAKPRYVKIVVNDALSKYKLEDKSWYVYTWGEGSWQIVLDRWKRSGSPKPEEARRRILL